MVLSLCMVAIYQPQMKSSAFSTDTRCDRVLDSINHSNLPNNRFCPMMQVSKLPWLLVAVSAFCNCIGNIFLKQSRLEVNSSNFLITITSPWLIAALISYCTALFLSAKALDVLPLSIVVPTSQGIGFIFVTLFSSWLFNENFTWQQFIAVILIFVGIVLMTR
jgi:multidrug transporter EmrE-like cation transporter